MATEEETTTPRSRGGNKTAVSIPGLAGIMEGLESHLGFLQFEDSQEGDNKFILGVCDELVDEEGGLREIDDEVMTMVDRATRIYAAMRSMHKGFAKAVAGDGRSEEAVAALEDLHEGILWEMRDDKGGLRQLDEEDFDFYDSITTFYVRLRS